MSLLLDANLSPALCKGLENFFPGICHVLELSLQAEDAEIWEFARSKELTIVTKDADFEHLSTLLGHPPKVILVRLGNCSTIKVENLLRMNHEFISDFIGNSEQSLLVLPGQNFAR